jgi:hypothetical protein
MSISQKREHLRQLQLEVKQLRDELQKVEAACPHQFSEPKAIQEAYQSPEMGNCVRQGSDIWYETNWVTRYRRAWTRECTLCGKVEITSKSKPTGDVVPDFGR